MNKSLKALGANELSRRLLKSLELNDKAHKKLEKWVEGFTTVAAELYKVKPDHELFKQMQPSTLAQVQEKVNAG